MPSFVNLTASFGSQSQPFQLKKSLRFAGAASSRPGNSKAPAATRSDVFQKASTATAPNQVTDTDEESDLSPHEREMRELEDLIYSDPPDDKKMKRASEMMNTGRYNTMWDVLILDTDPSVLATLFKHGLKLVNITPALECLT